MIIGWKAWFVGESQTNLITYESSDTSWDELPADGCLGVVLFESTLRPDGCYTKQPLAGYDWYFKAGDVYGCDNSNRLYEAESDIAKRYPNAHIIRGMWTTHDFHLRVQNEIREAQLCP